MENTSDLIASILAGILIQAGILFLIIRAALAPYLKEQNRRLRITNRLLIRKLQNEGVAKEQIAEILDIK